jgi:hypothetical protein
MYALMQQGTYLYSESGIAEYSKNKLPRHPAEKEVEKEVEKIKGRKDR